MIYSITRVQKTMTVFLTVHIFSALYLAYQIKNATLLWVLGGVSVMVFLSYFIISKNRIQILSWFSSLVLLLTSLLIYYFLKANQSYFFYHVSLVIVLMLYFYRGPLYFYGLSSALFFIGAYFINDQLAIYPQDFNLMDSYIWGALTAAVTFVAGFYMSKLKKLISFEQEAEVEVVQETPYLEFHELPYLYYLKAIGDNIDNTAKEVGTIAERNLQNIKREQDRLSGIMDVAHNVQKSFFRTRESVDGTKEITEKTLNAAITGDNKVTDIMQMVNKMIRFVDITKKSIHDLTSATKKVEGVIGLIDKIANQTRLLSLNASIEGARLQKQEGFVMVAREVKELSSLTHLSVQDITNTMRDIKLKTKAVREMLLKEAQEAMQGFEVARMGEASLKYVVRMMESIESQINQISEELDVNSNVASKITEIFATINSFLGENLSRMQELYEISDDLRIRGGHIGRIVHASQMSEKLAKQNDKTYSLLARFAVDFEKLIENQFRRGTITEETLFARKYQYIEMDELERYSSPYDDFFESHVQKLLDDYLASDNRLKYFIVMDTEGYIPLANNIYAHLKQEELDKVKVDIISKPGIILQDYISKHSLKNFGIYSLQCIQTKEEPIMDMSVHLRYHDRVWGVVRAGFRYT